jgi:hypothetical protein
MSRGRCCSLNKLKLQRCILNSVGRRTGSLLLIEQAGAACLGQQTNDGHCCSSNKLTFRRHSLHQASRRAGVTAVRRTRWLRLASSASRQTKSLLFGQADTSSQLGRQTNWRHCCSSNKQTLRGCGRLADKLGHCCSSNKLTPRSNSSARQLRSATCLRQSHENS